MTRRVFERSEVAHLWAHAAQDGARDKGGSFYFTGADLYSYGRHFIVARRCTLKGGRVVYLVNASTYSVTTSRHQAAARQAIPSFADVVRVPGLDEDATRHPYRIIEACGNAARAALSAAATTRPNSRKRSESFAHAVDMVAAARQIPDLFHDASADCRALMRAAVRKLPKMPASDSPADLQPLARETYAAKSREAAAIARRSVGCIREAIAEGPDGWRMRVDHNGRTVAESYGYASSVEESDRFAKLAGIRAPITKAERAEFAATLADLDNALTNGRAAWARSSLDHIRDAMPRYQGAGNVANAITYAKLAALHASDDDKAAAASLLVDLETLHREQTERDRAASAVRNMEQAGAHIRTAESYAAAGHYSDAMREHARAAQCITKAHGINPALDAPTLPDAAAWRMALDHQNAQRVNAWRNGDGTMYFHAYDAATLLRVVGDEIQTSRGARVPLSVAPMMWRIVTKARESGKAFVPASPIKVGYYSLTEIRADGSAVIGCHDIGYPEFERVARVLGYLDATAAA